MLVSCKQEQENKVILGTSIISLMFLLGMPNVTAEGVMYFNYTFPIILKRQFCEV